MKLEDARKVSEVDRILSNRQDSQSKYFIAKQETRTHTIYSVGGYTHWISKGGVKGFSNLGDISAQIDDDKWEPI
jgi:hypothetical protein